MTTADRCCRQCRTPYQGVCREKHGCLCHIAQRVLHKGEGGTTYPDPTANTAVRNADRGRKKRKGGRRA